MPDYVCLTQYLSKICNNLRWPIIFIQMNGLKGCRLIFEKNISYETCINCDQTDLSKVYIIKVFSGGVSRILLPPGGGGAFIP